VYVTRGIYAVQGGQDEDIRGHSPVGSMHVSNVWDIQRFISIAGRAVAFCLGINTNITIAQAAKKGTTKTPVDAL
jgi:hypothetical protein